MVFCLADILIKIVRNVFDTKTEFLSWRNVSITYFSAMDNGSGVFNYREGESDDDGDFVPFTQLTPSQQRVTQDPRLYHCTHGEQERAFERYVCLCDKNDV